MAYGTINFFSNILGQDMSVDYILPDTRRKSNEWTTWEIKRIPVIWILHGNSDNNNAWLRKSNIELYARQFNVAVIMPSCGREFYTDSKRGLNYFTYVSEELTTVMQNYLPISKKRNSNFIMGNSMGGYGALKCALTFPNRYSAVAAFAPVTAVGNMLKEIEQYAYQNGLKGEASTDNILKIIGSDLVDMERQLLYIFGNHSEFSNSNNNLYNLIDKINNKDLQKKLKVFTCCGTEDFLYNDNLEFRDYIYSKNLKNIEYKYSENHGDHDWFYWNQEIEQVFKFFGFDSNNDWNDSGIIKK